MNLLGLIVEYNPFHNGHLYHLNESKKITNATHTIAVMSGNFMQRGTPALLDKFTRAEMAVRNGVDLVVELPTLYACSTVRSIFASPRKPSVPKYFPMIDLFLILYFKIT